MPEPDTAAPAETAEPDAPTARRERSGKAAATAAALAAADAVPGEAVLPAGASALPTDDPLAPAEQAADDGSDVAVPAEAWAAPAPVTASVPPAEPVPPPVVAAPVVVPATPPPVRVAPVVATPTPVEEPTPASPPTSATPAPWLVAGGAAVVGTAAAGAAAASGSTPAFTPPLDAAVPEPEATIEVVRSTPPTGPIDTPWAKTETERTEIQTVRPPEEIVRPAGPVGIVCSACGTENEQSRRFCKSCGTLLVAPVPKPVVRATQKTRSFRLVLLVPILLAAGLLGFGGTVLLRGGLGGNSAATGLPTAAASGSDSHPSGAPASASAAATTKPALTKIPILGAKASSWLAPSSAPNDYLPRKAIDGSLKTSWQEGAKNENGQFIQVLVKAPADIASITIWAGSQAAEANYLGNLRPHNIEIKFDKGPAQPWELKDVFGPQDIELSGHADTMVTITIRDTYPSQKTALKGSPFDDCAISEIQLNGAP